MAESCILYGVSGSTKTSQIVHFAKWVYETTGKRTRLITGDGGGFKPIEDSGLVDVGVVDVFDYSACDFPLATLRRLSKGHWPYRVKGADGKVEVKIIPTPIAKWAEVGAYAVEGASSISDMLLSHVASQEEKVMFENVRYEEDGEVFGSNNEGHYGLVQKEIFNMVMAMKALPVDYVVWTALVGKGDDKKTRETLYGPQIAGNAKTPVAPQWFGTCLHLHQFMNEIKEEGTGITTYQNHPVAFFVNHPDEQTGIRYLAKPRCAPSEYPELVKMFPGGYISLEPDAGVEKYFKALGKLGVTGRAKTAAWKEKLDAGRAKTESASSPPKG
jgi:hypothetical protein